MRGDTLADFLYAEINVVGIVMLLLFLNNMNRNKHKNIPLDQAIFNLCMVLNIFIFVFDTGMWLLDGKPLSMYRIGNYIFTTLYYIFNPLICLVWLLYTDFKIYESRNGLIKRAKYYVIPCLISGLFSVLSIYNGWLFNIDSNNIYMRGSHFWIMAVASLIYLIFSSGMALRNVMINGWKENKSINIHLVIFPIGIIVASLIQIMFFGVSIIWICGMIALASIYINIQNGEISTDHLTGLYNRRRLDEHLQRRTKLIKKDKKLFAIILDLDQFKHINDKYGHATGDEALIKTAELLRQACKGSDDFIARMGGDEFIIIGERASISEIEKLMEEILACTSSYNNLGEVEYLILPSMGYSVYDRDNTIDSFLAIADQEMYRNKEERKLVT